MKRLAAIPGSGPAWPRQLLGESGRLKLLLEAFGRIESLAPPLAWEVRQLIGWTAQAAELEASGESVTDSWVVVGQTIDDEDRLQVQRSWLLGRQVGRLALVLQFSVANQPFPESILPGTEQVGTLQFYPGALRLRARWQTRTGTLVELAGSSPGVDCIEEFLTSFAESHARLPWLNLLGGVIRRTVLVPGKDIWHLVDATDQALPLVGRAYWRLLAISGGRPADISGEWDGARWRPMGMFCDGRFWGA